MVEREGALEPVGGDVPGVQEPALSTNSVHRLVDGALHEDLVADEEDAAATSHAILDAVSAVRTAAPLSK